MKPPAGNAAADALRLLSPREALDEWDRLEPHIRRVLEYVDSGQLPDDVLTAAQLGSMQIWNILDGKAVCVTELQTFTRYRQLLIYLVAGARPQDWIAQGQRQLEAFAKQNSCRYMIYKGRPGWERYARQFGWGDKFVMLRKALK